LLVFAGFARAVLSRFCSQTVTTTTHMWVSLL